MLKMGVLMQQIQKKIPQAVTSKNVAKNKILKN